MKKLLAGLFLVIILVTGTAIYSLSQDNIENIIVCSTNEDANYIPSDICELYLLNFRGNEADIKYLTNRTGINFLTNIENAEKRNRLFGFFLEKGMNINARSTIDGLTPLHAAILLNDYELVAYLLQNGADINTSDRDNGLTALQFLQLLNNKNPDINRSVVIKLLSSKSSDLAP